MGDAITFQIRTGVCKEKIVKSWGSFPAQSKVPMIFNHMTFIILKKRKAGICILRVFIEARHDEEWKEIHDL